MCANANLYLLTHQKVWCTITAKLNFPLKIKYSAKSSQIDRLYVTRVDYKFPTLFPLLMSDDNLCKQFRPSLTVSEYCLYTLANSVDPNEMPGYTAFYQGLHCLLKNQ